ncbi:MAG: hypothetical protein ACK4VZ_11105 [Paracoccaceae bacterium]
MTANTAANLALSMFHDAETEDATIADVAPTEGVEDDEYLVARATHILETRILDGLLQKLTGEGKRAEDTLDAFQVFLRAGFLGIDVDTQSKLIARLDERKKGG